MILSFRGYLDIKRIIVRNNNKYYITIVGIVADQKIIKFKKVKYDPVLQSVIIKPKSSIKYLSPVIYNE